MKDKKKNWNYFKIADYIFASIMRIFENRYPKSVRFRVDDFGFWRPNSPLEKKILAMNYAQLSYEPF